MHSECLGPYQLGSPLGRGGHGHVYGAVHTKLGKRVAVKMLHHSLGADPIARRRFCREARAASSIAHPNVVAVHEFSLDHGRPYLVMDFVEGVHLGRYLRAHGPLPLSELVAIGLPICSAVSAIHAAGIVHRDLKPSNVMLTRDKGGGRRPIVLDFGTAKLEFDDDDSLQTATGSVLGTTQYMAPEHLRRPREADHRSDQYALGVILYECATGQRPYSGEGQYELMRAIMTAPLAAPSELNPSLPPAFDALVMRALARRAVARFDSVSDLGRALLELADDRTRAVWADEFTASARGVEAVDDELLGFGEQFSSPTWRSSRMNRTPGRAGSTRFAKLAWLVVPILTVATSWLAFSRPAENAHATTDSSTSPRQTARAGVGASSEPPAEDENATATPPGTPASDDPRDEARLLADPPRPMVDDGNHQPDLESAATGSSARRRPPSSRSERPTAAAARHRIKKPGPKRTFKPHGERVPAEAVELGANGAPILE